MNCIDSIAFFLSYLSNGFCALSCFFFFFLSITKAILVLFAITPKVRTIFKIFKEMSVQSLFFDSVATTMFLFFFFF